MGDCSTTNTTVPMVLLCTHFSVQGQNLIKHHCTVLCMSVHFTISDATGLLHILHLQHDAFNTSIFFTKLLHCHLLYAWGEGMQALMLAQVLSSLQSCQLTLKAYPVFCIEQFHPCWLSLLCGHLFLIILFTGYMVT